MYKNNIINLIAIFIIASLIIPMIKPIIISFYYYNPSKGALEPSLHGYYMLYNNQKILDSMIYSFKISIIASVFSVTMGVLGGIGLYASSGRMRSFYISILIINTILPDVMIGIYSLSAVLALEEFFGMNIRGPFVIGFVHGIASISFVAFLIFDSLSKMDSNKPFAAMIFGNNIFHVISVIFPNIKVAIICGFGISIIFSMDDLLISMLLNIEHQSLSEVLFATQKMSNIKSIQQVNAFHTLSTIVGLVLFFIYEIINNFNQKRINP